MIIEIPQEVKSFVQSIEKVCSDRQKRSQLIEMDDREAFAAYQRWRSFLGSLMGDW